MVSALNSQQQKDVRLLAVCLLCCRCGTTYTNAIARLAGQLRRIHVPPDIEHELRPPLIAEADFFVVALVTVSFKRVPLKRGVSDGKGSVARNKRTTRNGHIYARAIATCATTQEMKPIIISRYYATITPVEHNDVRRLLSWACCPAGCCCHCADRRAPANSASHMCAHVRQAWSDQGLVVARVPPCHCASCVTQHLGVLSLS